MPTFSRPVSRNVRLWATVGVVAGVVLVLIKGYRLITAVQDAGRAPVTDPSPEVTPGNFLGLHEKAVGRDTFRKTVIGKFRTEVSAAYGEPIELREEGREWVYRRITLNFDGSGIAIDGETGVRFDAEGKAVDVVFPATQSRTDKPSPAISPGPADGGRGGE